jgi:hypothetical protein
MNLRGDRDDLPWKTVDVLEMATAIEEIPNEMVKT